MESSSKLCNLPNLMLIEILMFNEVDTFLNLIQTCKKMWDLFNEHPIIFKNYLGIANDRDQELEFLQTWNSEAKRGFYNDPVNCRKQLYKLLKNTSKQIDVLAYKTDGGQTDTETGNWVKNILIKDVFKGYCSNYSKYKNVNVTAVVLPFSVESQKKYITGKNEQKSSTQNQNDIVHQEVKEEEEDDEYMGDESPYTSSEDDSFNYNYLSAMRSLLNSSKSMPCVQNDLAAWSSNPEMIVSPLPFYCNLEDQNYKYFKISKNFQYVCIKEVEILRTYMNYTRPWEVFALYAHDIPTNDFSFSNQMDDAIEKEHLLKSWDKKLVTAEGSTEEGLEFVEFKNIPLNSGFSYDPTKPRIVGWFKITDIDEETTYSYKLRIPVMCRFVTLKLIHSSRNKGTRCTDIDWEKFLIKGDLVDSDFYYE